MSGEMDWLRDSIDKARQDKRLRDERVLESERARQEGERQRIAAIEEYRRAAQPHVEATSAFLERIRETIGDELKGIKVILTGPNFEELSILGNIYDKINPAVRRSTGPIYDEDYNTYYYYAQGFRWEIKNPDYPGSVIKCLIINLLLDKNSQPFYYIIIRQTHDKWSHETESPILSSLQDEEAKNMFREWATDLDTGYGVRDKKKD